MGMIVLRITLIFSSTEYCFRAILICFKELAVIKTAGWYIFFILYEKQDNVN